MIPIRVSTRATLPLLLVFFGAPNVACLSSASSWLEGSAGRADTQTAARTERKRTRAALEVGTRYELWPLAYVIHRVETAPLLDPETMQETPKQQYAIVAFDFTVENISDAPYSLPTGSMKLTASPWEFTPSIDGQRVFEPPRLLRGAQGGFGRATDARELTGRSAVRCRQGTEQDARVEVHVARGRVVLTATGAHTTKVGCGRNTRGAEADNLSEVPC